MLTFQGRTGVASCAGVSRRDFLRVGALAAGGVGLSLSELNAVPATSFRQCIVLFLVGGPSQLDTWDLKPNAPSTIRGPFRPIRTNVPGVEISECFPRMARMADRYAILRSVHHDAAPIHETGHQLMQTGKLFQAGEEHPGYGAVVSRLLGSTTPDVPPAVVVPSLISNTGVSVGHGQGAGWLGPRSEPIVLTGDLDPARLPGSKALVDAVDDAQRVSEDSAPDQIFSPRTKKALDLTGETAGQRSRYGKNTFGQSCLLARRLIENGVRLVTVNMFDTVFNEITWDCHADGGALATTLDDYRHVLCPMFDKAYSALLDDLHQRGLLESTLVVAMGEFGRTPHLNLRGGRDHWPSVWSVLFAGGGVRGGQVVGASDAQGGTPADRPVHPSEIAASVYHSLGIDPHTRLAGPNHDAVVLTSAEPIGELFGL